MSLLSLFRLIFSKREKDSFQDELDSRRANLIAPITEYDRKGYPARKLFMNNYHGEAQKWTSARNAADSLDAKEGVSHASTSTKSRTA